MSFTIDLRWPQGHVASEDAADIRMKVGSRLLTGVTDLRTEGYRDHFQASTVSLSFWLADNWWRLRHEPVPDNLQFTPEFRLRHEMSSGSSNELWPPLMISGSGPRVIITSRAGSEAGGSLQYHDDRAHALPGNIYESELEDFFQTVLRECAAHADAKALGELVTQINNERADTELSAWRRLEACLGFNTDQAPEALITKLLRRERHLGVAAVEEAAVAAPGIGSSATLEDVYQAARNSTVKIRFDTAVSATSPLSLTSQSPWEAAEDAANHLRNVLALPDVITGQTLGDLLQVRWEDLKNATATARRLPYGARTRTSATRNSVALQMEPQIDRRFELARVIGDHYWSAPSSFGVVSRARTDRQKFQRAFARALLCPMHRLKDIVDLRQPSTSSIMRAARIFDVRPKVIEIILETRGYLRSYGSPPVFENV